MHLWFNMIKSDKKDSSRTQSSDPKQTFAGENILFLFSSVPSQRTIFAGEMILGVRGALACLARSKIPWNCMLPNHMNWRRGNSMQLSLRHIYTHTSTHIVLYATHTAGTQRLHSPPQKTTKVTSKYSAPPSATPRVALCLSKCLVLWNLKSISSFWGLPPWHYGDPWCLHPVAEKQMWKTRKKKEEGEREK